MMGDHVPPPDDPEYWKAQAERRSELLRSGRSTDGLAGVILELLWGLARLLLSGLIRRCQWGRAQGQKRS
jgi:hypothetical protein